MPSPSLPKRAKPNLVRINRNGPFINPFDAAICGRLINVVVFGSMPGCLLTRDRLVFFIASDMILSAVLRYAVSGLPAGQHGLRSLPSQVIHAIDLLSRERGL
jgi:hypothetical protein